jgi:hypothetical protein
MLNFKRFHDQHYRHSDDDDLEHQAKLLA